MSLEDRLRRSLQARAEDVTPDPGMFSVVQSRIRRARTFRLALAGVAATLAVAGVAIAAPALIDRRIEFEPAPVATQPGEDATPTEGDLSGSLEAPTDRAEGMVFMDGSAAWVMALDGETAVPLGGGNNQECSPACLREPDTWAVTATDASLSGVTVAMTGRPCDSVTWGSFTLDGDEADGEFDSYPYQSEGCPTAPMFSPDGTHLAFVTPGFRGAWSLHTVDWTEAGPGNDGASFDLEIGPADAVTIDEWIWTDRTDTDAVGYLVLSAEGDEGDQQLIQMPIERQGDGALALTGEPEPHGIPEGYELVALADSGEPGGSLLYTLEARRSDGAWRLVGSDFFGPADQIVSLDLPASMGPLPDNLSDMWMSAYGGTVVFGDGHGSAWLTELTTEGFAEPRKLEATIVHADLFATAEETAPAPSGDLRDVEVFFGMTGADACVADQAVTREVAGPGVARGALTELLKGPSSRESNEGIVSPFNANTAGALRDITIVDGQARVDFTDFSEAVENDSCTKSAIVDSLNKTLFQFPTVESTLYSFNGDAEAFEAWLGRHSEALTPPGPVVDTQKAIYDAALGRDWKTLRGLSAETSCTLSDQKEPCVPFWKDQERQGKDPLGVMVDLLSGGAAKNPNAPIWVYPPEWADPDSGYDGPRIGIDEDGVWRYFVLEGG